VDSGGSLLWASPLFSVGEGSLRPVAPSGYDGALQGAFVEALSNDGSRLIYCNNESIRILTFQR
jgi:hypothetical protein